MAGLSLLDIRRKTVKVKIDDDQEVEVVGLSFETISRLLERFPVLFDALSGKLAFGDLAKKAPEAIAAVIAAGVDKLGDNDHEKAALALGLGIQFELCQGIGTATFPKGVRPLLDTLTGTFGANVAPQVTAPATNSPRPSPDLNAIRSRLAAKNAGRSRHGKQVRSFTSTAKSTPPSESVASTTVS